MLNLDRLHEAVRHEGGVSRRLFLAYAAALAAVPLPGGRAEGRTSRRPPFAADPFALGVASGDPTARGVVLWTRLAPEPLEPGGGMPPENVEVAWEVAADEAMSSRPPGHGGRHAAARPLGPRRGRRPGARPLVLVPLPRRRRREPRRPHPHHARPGRAPDRCASPSPRASTTRRASITAYEHMAKDDLDLVIHLGDYIYEGPGRDGRSASTSGRRSTRSRTTASATPSTRPTRTCRRCTPAAPGSSPGTTTSSTTTAPTPSPRRRTSTRPPSSSGGPTPTRPITR